MDRTQKLKREKELRQRLQELQGPIRTQDIIEEESFLLWELDKWWTSEESFWAQRSRNGWLQEGDQNTGFFHASTIRRKHRNRILKLRDALGNWLDKPDELDHHVNDFYRHLFESRRGSFDHSLLTGFPALVTDEINNTLTAQITKEEVRKAVFQLGANKAPGPDGFPGHFFRTYWSCIEDIFCKEIFDFFRTGIMTEGWNDTFITLIPKVDHPEMIGQFRPISCCNFRYKVITKIMTIRLQPWLPNLVNELQAAFTGGRQIQDNIVIVHEVLNQFKKNKKKKKKEMMLKLDMKKAYDLVEWDFLINLLKAYGFNDTWCGWVQACISTVKFRLLFNGAPSTDFTPSRGIRQGDPLSPLLFILMSNSLSFMIEKAAQRQFIKGIKLNRECPILTHCLFADDTVIFGEASVREADNILSIIHDYGSITGQEVNREKSSMFLSIIHDYVPLAVFCSK
ncbi:unnamed protein product [Linum trigynum]|uniref:Reverse transcriptase domain-containing protein n=1 Tax=Linum trigynum TaxID=586398 RepID=A0AAV2D7G0_9ROSI